MSGALRAIALSLVTFVAACFGLAKSPTPSEANQAVVLVAGGVHLLDETCATATRAAARVDKAKATALGEACVKSYTIARASLVVAGDGVDSWRATGDSGGLRCGLTGAVAAIQDGIAGIQAAGQTVPPQLLQIASYAPLAGLLVDSSTCIADTGADAGEGG